MITQPSYPREMDFSSVHRRGVPEKKAISPLTEKQAMPGRRACAARAV